MAQKILIIPSWYPTEKNELRGSFFKEQALLLNKNGFDVKLLFAVEEEVGFFKYLSKLVGSFLKKRNDLSTNVLKQEPEAYSFNTCRYKKRSVKFKITKNKKRYEKAFKELTQNWKPELIHAQCTANAGIYASHLSNTFSIHYVIIEHQVFLLNHYKKRIQKEIVSALENASKVGAVSYHQQRCILMNNISCDPVVIWNLLDESKFTLPKNDSNSKFTIVTITYQHPIKDTLTFFKSLGESNKISDGDFEVVIIGNSAFKKGSKASSDLFKTMAKEHNVLDKCTFYPKLNRTEINTQLQQANVFISTSIAETYGIAVREAMLCGTPVIATKSGGIEDSISTETGIKVNLKDYKAIAQNILKIQNKDIVFNPQKTRDFVIRQSGRKAFIKKMTSFYQT